MHGDSRELTTASIIALARILAGFERSGPPGATAEVESEDRRAATWDRLRASLRPLAEADAESEPGRLAVGARAVTDARILRLDRGEALPDEADGELEALTGSPAADVVACAYVLDDLRRLNETGRISGELGWAMRRWAWAELRRALARLDAGEEAVA